MRNTALLFNRRTIGRWSLGMVLLAGLILGVHWVVGWPRLLSPWRDFPIEKLAVLLALTALSYLLRAVRVYECSRELVRSRFTSVLRLSIVHNTVNNFLPMRLGEIAYPLLMKRYFGQAYAAGAATLIWIRAFDLHLLGLLALVFLYQAESKPVWLVLTLPWITLAPAIYLMRGWIQRRAYSPKARLVQLLSMLTLHLPNNAWCFFRVWFWTALSWGFKFSAYTAVVLHFAEIDTWQAVFGIMGAELSSILPIHGVAGSGTYEAAMAAVLLPLGLDVRSVLTVAVNLHLYLLGTNLILVAIALCLPGPKESP